MAAILTDVIFKYKILNDNFHILIRISLKFVPKGPIDYKPALIQVMAWHRTGNKQLSEPMTAYFAVTYLHYSCQYHMLNLYKEIYF